MRGKGGMWQEESGRKSGEGAEWWTGEMHDGMKAFANLFPLPATRTAF